MADNALCSVLRLDSDLIGTVNPDDGSSDFVADLRSKVHIGIDQTQPCPVCVGDVTAGDGLMQGVCDYGEFDPGPHNGQPCDVQGFQGTFANEGDGIGLSLDCPPGDGKNISGTGLKVPIDFTTGTSSLPFETNCDDPFPPLPAFVCACAVCSIDTTKRCANNADCEFATEGTCTAFGGGQAAPRAPNGCSTLECTVIGGGRGECTAEGLGDTSMFCDGDVRAGGEGYLVCNENSDCASIDPICSGNDCGDCLLSKNRPCFLDPIEFTGAVDPDNPVLAATFCVPPTANETFNLTLGYPGPGRVRAQSVVKGRFK